MIKKFIILFTATVFLSGCEKLLIQPNENETGRNIKDFNEIRRIINTYFPYLDSMKINWDSICTVYEPLVEKVRGDEIDQVFVEMLSNLKDGHTSFTSKGARYATYTCPHLIKDFYAYSPEVVRSYFSKKLKVIGKIEYEISDQNIGYLHLTDFVKGSWMNDFDRALNYFNNTKGMIFDLRHNQGGNTDMILEVIRRFINGNTVYIEYSKSLKVNEYQIIPGSLTYVKPIVILINGCSASAAEDLSAFLDQYSYVTLVGDSTIGIDGRMNDYNLPSGKVLTTIYMYTLFRGKHFQCIGVTPDILIPQTENDIKHGRDKQLEYAIEFLNKK